MKSSLCLALSTLIAAGAACTALAQNNYTLNPLGSFGGNGDGSIRPDDTGYVTYQFGTNSYQQRGMACDPVSGNLVIVDPHAGQSGSSNMLGSIFVVDGSSGAQLGTLSTNGISGGAWAASSAGVADDGAVYVCNQVTVSTNTTTPLKIYRWASTSSSADPTVAFSGTLVPSQRYGATMDVRGSGNGTQIILGSTLGQSGTNVVLFTTADGVSFTANVLACTNISGAFSTDGVAFGTNNTFWAKRVGGPLYFMSYDLTAKTAKVVASFSTNMPGYLNLGTLAADNVNHLLGAIESSGGSERVWLFDITDPTQPPTLLSIRSFAANNPNASAPLGNLDFGSGRLYAHVVNNGLLASSVDLQPTAPPTIYEDLPPVTRVAVGQTAHFEVVAYPGVTSYQWETNTVNVSGATSAFLNVTNVQLSDNGKQYTVSVGNSAANITSSTSVLSVFNPASLAHLDLLWAAAPDSTNYVSNGGAGAPNERNIAYSPVANQLLVVRRAAPFVSIYVLNPTNGALLYNLKTDGINGGTIPLQAIAVADDGAIYACNIQDNTTSPSIKIYRWASSSPTILPALIFSGNPTPNVNTASTRWGDTLAARGSGANTQLLLDNNDASTLNRYVALITPTDGSLNTWTARGWAQQNQDSSALVGRSIQFGLDSSGVSTFWQKKAPQTGGAPLVQSSFNINDAGLVSVIVASSPSGADALSTNGPVGLDLGGSQLGATVDYPAAYGNAGTIPTTLDLFDLTSVATPVLLNRYNFPVNQIPNSTPSAEVLFVTNSATGKNMVFALNGNNGLVAYSFAFGNVSAPRFLLQPRNTRIIQGGSASLTTVLDQFGTGVGLQWQRNTVPVPNATNGTLTLSGFATNAGTYTAVATNSTGTTVSQAVTVTVDVADNNYSLTPLWSKAPAGSVGGANYVSSTGGANTPNERGFGYNASANQVLVVQRQGSASTAYQVKVVDGATGNYLNDMSTVGINAAPGSEVAGANAIGLVDIVAADDGAIFACNSSPNSSGGSNAAPTKMFEVYRWPSSSGSAVLSPVFLGDPSGQGPTNNVRWGDQMAVRGSGANTELLFDSNDGARAAILKPDTSGGFSNVFPLVTVSFNASIGRNTQFATGTNFWQKRKGEPLQLTSYNTNNQSSLFVPFGSYPLSLGALAVDSTRNIAVGIDYAASTAKAVLYDVSDPNAPMLLSSANFPSANANANFIGKVIISGNKVFALNGNNGVLAFTLQNPVGRPSLGIAQAGSNVLLSWGTNHVGWALQSTPSLNPASWSTAAGSPAVVGSNFVVTNALGSTTFYRLSQ